MSGLQEDELVDRGAIPPDDFHSYIERIRDVAEYDIETPTDLAERIISNCRDLLIDPDVLVSAAAALQAGNLVIQGPPGTGKSSLARALCKAFHCSVITTTAHEEWTTYEVIGRQELRVDDRGAEQIVPVNGFFTEAVIHCAGSIVRHFDDPTEPQATWLLIDELNRSHPDRAFGELFTALGTDERIPISLSHQTEGNRKLVTPRRFRLIATLNSVDRQFVNSLGQGLKRRFTFITLDIPSPRNQGESWGENDGGSSIASQEFVLVANKAVERVAKRRSLGDQDLLNSTTEALVDILLNKARPQMESLFDLAEGVRYAEKGVDLPHLPLGTAHLIDVVELFLEKIQFEDPTPERLRRAIDWATATKLAPLFDTDTISPADLETFAENLPAPFDILLRRELLQIAAAGQYYVG